MKNLRKMTIAVLALTMIFAFSACTKSNTPTVVVEKQMQQIKDEQSETELSSLVSDASIAKKYKKQYQKLLEKIQDFDYEVTDEKIDGDSATVTVKITTYNFGKAYQEMYEQISKDAAAGKISSSTDTTNYIYKLMFSKMNGLKDKDYSKKVTVQRATGYGWRKAITIDQIKEWAEFVHEINPDIIRMVDNCYGEFLHTYEPTQVGADIIAGSLIKNPGGGLALTGGYVTGRADLVERISYRMTCPGIGGECGLTFGQTRTMLQGLFLAPRTVNGAVKGAILCGRVFEKLGYDVCPKPEDERSDIIEAVRLGSPEAVVAFCKGIQAAAPIDSYVSPEPWDMPGYEDPVVMAAGAFVQGSSIELSADAPIREPYNVYFQGGITYEHSKFGVIKALQKLYDEKLLNI